LALLEGGGLSLSGEFARWLADFHARLFAAAEKDIGTVGEALLRGVLGDDAWELLPETVRQVFTANGPAIVAEERGGMTTSPPPSSARSTGRCCSSAPGALGRNSPRRRS
jgi:hypothetical protein